MGAAVFPTLARRFVATDDGTVTDARGVVTFVPAFGFGVVLLGSVVVVVGGGTEVTVTTVEESLGEVAAVDGTVAGVDFAADALVIRRSKGDSALFAAAELVPDNDGRTIARDAISAAVVLPSVLAPGVDTKPAARNSSARTASVRAKRGRTHSLPPSVASQSR
jgi:hypothetical protein